MTGWQPIESAPNDGTRIIAWHKNYDAPVTVQLYGDWWSVAYDLGPLKHQPTHWMPLPAPPRS
jgi:hypothetical protein